MTHLYMYEKHPQENYVLVSSIYICKYRYV